MSPEAGGTTASRAPGLWGSPLVSVGAIRLGAYVISVASLSVVAAAFGAGAERDAWVVAVMVAGIAVNLLTAFLLEPVVPAFLSERFRGPDAGWSIVTALVIAGLGLTAVLASLGWVGGGAVVGWIAPGFEADRALLAAELLVLVVVGTALLRVAAVLGRILNALGLFAWPEILALSQPVALIALTYTAGPTIGILALGWGTVASGVMALVGSLVALRACGYTPVAAGGLSSLWRLTRLSGPLAINEVLGQAVTTAISVLGSQLKVGSLAALSFGQRLFEAPNNALMTTVSLVRLPALSRHYLQEHGGELAAEARTTVRLVLTFAVLASVLGVVGAGPATRLILQRGAFTAEDAALTATLFATLMIGLGGYGLSQASARLLIAMHQTRLQAILGASTLAANLLLAIVLVAPFGVLGLAGAGVIAHGAGGLAGTVVALQQAGERSMRWLGRFFVQVAVAGMAAAAASSAAAGLVPVVLGEGPLVDLASCVLLTVGGAAAYILVGAKLRIPEIRALAELPRRVHPG